LAGKIHESGKPYWFAMGIGGRGGGAKKPKHSLTHPIPGRLRSKKAHLFFKRDNAEKKGKVYAGGSLVTSPCETTRTGKNSLKKGEMLRISAKKTTKLFK